MDEFIHLFHIEDLEAAENQHPNVQRNPQNPFTLSDTHFIKMFRLTKNLTRYLIDILTPYLRAPRRRTDLEISTKVSWKLNEIISNFIFFHLPGIDCFTLLCVRQLSKKCRTQSVFGR